MAVEGRPQLHITALNMLSFCGEQFRRRYVEGEIIPPGIAAIVGKATDHSVTRNLQNKIDHAELLPLEAVLDEARDGFERAWQSEGVRLTTEEVQEGVEKIKGEAIDKAIRLSQLHAEAAAPLIQPSHVQRELVVTIKGYDYDLAMTLDVQEGAERIRDTKTAKKSPPKDAADDSDQLTQYALGVRVVDGMTPKEVALDYLVDNKTPIYKPLVSTRDERDFRVLLNRLESGILAIQRGVFVPVKRTDPMCSPKYCGYFSTCRYVREPRSVTTQNGATE